MKHRLFLIIATAACLGSFTACSQDNDIVVPDGDLKAAISFNVNIGQTPDPQVSMRGASTDATTAGYVFSNGDKICVAITGDGTTSARSTTEEKKLYKVETANVDASATTPGTPQTLVYDGTATDAFTWMSQSEQIALRAWSYGNSTTTTTDPNGSTFTISTTQNSNSDVKELLYSPGPQSPNTTNYSYSVNSSSLNIPLYHQLARVVVNVTNTESDKYQDDGFTISSVVIGSTTNKIPTSATFAKPASGHYGSWSSQGTDGTVTAKAETTVSGNKATYSAVIIPYDGETNSDNYNYYHKDDEFIVITTSRGVYAYSLASNLNIQSGKQYTFNITNLNEIKLNVTVTAWTADANQSLTLE
ncbi:MAG: fimbrillin family protein [Prevotella sp.]|nr:fimbrillin family protein [Prevotella sp.]